MPSGNTSRSRVGSRPGRVVGDSTTGKSRPAPSSEMCRGSPGRPAAIDRDSGQPWIDAVGGQLQGRATGLYARAGQLQRQRDAQRAGAEPQPAGPVRPDGDLTGPEPLAIGPDPPTPISSARALGRMAAVSPRSSSSTFGGVPGAAARVSARPLTLNPGPSVIPAASRPVRSNRTVAVPPGGAGGRPGPNMTSQPPGAEIAACALHGPVTLVGMDRSGSGVTTRSNTGPPGSCQARRAPPGRSGPARSQAAPRVPAASRAAAPASRYPVRRRSPAAAPPTSSRRASGHGRRAAVRPARCRRPMDHRRARATG